MTEQIYEDIYRIEIPLPRNPLRALNSYFIRGTDRNLLIDTGFNQPECKEAMLQGIQELGFTMENTDLFITHVHSDHTGLVHFLATPTTKVYCSNYTALALSRKQALDLWSYYDDMMQQGGLTGIQLSDHPGFSLASESYNDAIVLKDGDEIQVGKRTLRCIETTGHAPDHLCLYEPEGRILFSGDHILGNITPNNTIWETPWEAKVDYLGEYLKSLDKVAALEIQETLPAHRERISDTVKRIQELKEHHRARLEDVLTILGREKMHGEAIASQMKWSIRGRNWAEFPAAQKIFATGEALAHLTHLVMKNTLRRELIDGVVYYSLSSGGPPDAI